jgi:hypothetical protein
MTERAVWRSTPLRLLRRVRPLAALASTNQKRVGLPDEEALGGKSICLVLQSCLPVEIWPMSCTT